MSDYKNNSTDLTLHWFFASLFLCLLIAYNVICHTIGAEIQINMGEDQRIFIKSILYAVAIILFPLTNLLRHILLRLNQTMPGDNPAKNRYFITTVITLLTIEIVGLFGLAMFILGDSYNTLYIFTTLAILGIFLHRPRIEEYNQIIDALRSQQSHNE